MAVITVNRKFSLLDTYRRAVSVDADGKVTGTGRISEEIFIRDLDKVDRPNSGYRVRMETRYLQHTDCLVQEIACVVHDLWTDRDVDVFYKRTKYDGPPKSEPLFF